MAKEKIWKNCRAQSMVEYVILISTVIAVALLFARQGGIFQNAINASVDKSMNTMFDMANKIFE